MWVGERVRPREGGVRGRKRGRGMEVLKIIGNENCPRNGKCSFFCIFHFVCLMYGFETRNHAQQIAD